MWRARWVLIAISALLVSGCGLAGAGDSATPNYSDEIGTAISSTTTTTSLPVTSQERSDSGAIYRDLIERTVAAEEPAQAEGGSEVTGAQPNFCFAMELFVFESTQMLLQEDVAGMLERYGRAVSAMDSVIAEAPGQIPQLAQPVHQTFTNTVQSPGTTDSKETFTAAINSMVAGNFGALFDQLFDAMALECGASLTEPYIPSQQGLENVTGT